MAHGVCTLTANFQENTGQQFPSGMEKPRLFGKGFRFL